MHCGHLLIKLVRKVLFTHFLVAEREIETGYKPFTKSCNNLVTELLTDAWISESFYPLLPWHRTPFLLASNFVWKTFLRKCCWVQKKKKEKDILGSRIFLWTKVMGLTYCSLQAQPNLFFKSRCRESLRKGDQNEVTVAHFVQGAWGRAEKKGRKRRAGRKNSDCRINVKPEAHPQVSSGTSFVLTDLLHFGFNSKNLKVS